MPLNNLILKVQYCQFYSTATPHIQVNIITKKISYLISKGKHELICYLHHLYIYHPGPHVV